MDAQTETTILINPGSSSPSNLRFYSPPYLEVSKDTTVTWRNSDSLAHSVTFINPQLRNNIDGSQEIVAPNSQLAYVFKEPGVYDYYYNLSFYDWENRGKVMLWDALLVDFLIISWIVVDALHKFD